MSNQTIEQIAAAGEGETTEDDVYREQIVRELLYTQAGNLSVGTQLVGTTNFDTLDVQFNYPGEMTAEYPVGRDATTNRKKIGWREFDMTLRQAQSRYFIADSAKLRGVSDMQQRMTQQRSGEALARRKDENILGKLAEGAYSENEESMSGGNTWDSDDVNIEDELQAMWTDILVNAPVNNVDIGNFAVVMPIQLWTKLNQIELINNVQQQLRDYLGQAFGFSIYPTKLGMHEDDQLDLQDTCIMLIPGDDTAIHGVMNSSAATNAGVPLVEQERVFGKGDEYLVKQWYNTRVLEHEAGGGAHQSPRIAVRTNVNSNAD